jgi:membrane fusion protein (multidrug efflux system)
MDNAEAPAAKKKSGPLGLLVVLVLVVGAGFGLYLVLNPALGTDNAMVDRTKATVSTKLMGVIAKINTDEEALVEKGAVLVELDAAELLAQKKQAEANLELIQESIQQSQVAMDRAQADFNRAQSQYTEKVISTEAFEHAQKAFESAQVDFTLAQKKVDIAQAQLGVIDASLRNATMTAPFDAVVAKKWLEAGDVLQPGEPILTLYDRHSAWITANFEETKIAQFHVGQSADVRVDSYPGVVFHGQVAQIGSNTGNQFSLLPVNNAAGNFTKVTQRIPIKITLRESTDLGDPRAVRLLPGMSAVVEVKP